MYDFSLSLYCQRKCSSAPQMKCVNNYELFDSWTTLLLRNLIWTRCKLGDVQTGHIEAVWFSSMLLVLLLFYIQSWKFKKETYTVGYVLLLAECAVRWYRIKPFYHIKKSTLYFSVNFHINEIEEIDIGGGKNYG